MKQYCKLKFTDGRNFCLFVCAVEKSSKCLGLKYQARLGVLGFKTKPLASGGKDGPGGQISSYFSCNKWVISILILIISIEEVSMMIMSNHHSIYILGQ